MSDIDEENKGTSPRFTPRLSSWFAWLYIGVEESFEGRKRGERVGAAWGEM